MKVWENSKKLWKHSPAAHVPTAFLVLPNFHSCFYNSIETRYMFSISLNIVQIAIIPWAKSIRTQKNIKVAHLYIFNVYSARTNLKMLIRTAYILSQTVVTTIVFLWTLICCQLRVSLPSQKLMLLQHTVKQRVFILVRLTSYVNLLIGQEKSVCCQY